VIERALPGAATQIGQHTCTFFDTDIPTLLTWIFGLRTPAGSPSGAAHRRQRSGQWFAEVRELMLA